MSYYEGMNGNGMVMKKDLMELKKKLIQAHNLEIAGEKPSNLKKYGLSRASNRTTNFPILLKLDEDWYYVGAIQLYPATGEFQFSIGENNHAMDDAEKSRTFRCISQFIRSLPKKGKKYGAKTYYWGEDDVDEYGNKAAGTYSMFGAW